MIAQTYAELALRTRGAEKQDAAERLYALNPGGLRQKGISLPVELQVETSGTPDNAAKLEKNLRRTLGRAGIDVIPAGRFQLRISLEPEGEALCQFYDSGRGASLFTRRFTLKSSAPEDLRAFVRALGEELFTVP